MKDSVLLWYIEYCYTKNDIRNHIHTIIHSVDLSVSHFLGQNNTGYITREMICIVLPNQMVANKTILSFLIKRKNFDGVFWVHLI